MRDEYPVAVGDVVDVDRNLSKRGHQERPVRGEVIEVYPSFAVVRFPAGYKESWEYRRLTVVREAKRRAG